jgi:hypothetical protein
MKVFLRKHLLIIVFSLAGAAGGFLYWRFVGCNTGTCPIKSVWYLMTLWGLAFGYLAGSIVSEVVDKFHSRRNAGE